MIADASRPGTLCPDVDVVGRNRSAVGSQRITWIAVTPFYHPFLGRSGPRVTELLSRCNLPAAMVLSAIQTLAGWRCESLATAGRLHDAATTAPWLDEPAAPAP